MIFDRRKSKKSYWESRNAENFWQTHCFTYNANANDVLKWRQIWFDFSFSLSLSLSIALSLSMFRSNPISTIQNCVIVPSEISYITGWLVTNSVMTNWVFEIIFSSISYTCFFTNKRNRNERRSCIFQKNYHQRSLSIAGSRS